MTKGARFLRADLHIHSYGEFGSYDVKDTAMTPEAIVDTAIAKGLKIISITDHNEIFNSNTAINYAADKDILIIPGIEVTTTQGHLLLYFDTFQNLRSFAGKLNISEDKKTTTQGIVECLDFAHQYSGVGILAHIELDSGFEKTIGRFGPPIEEIFSHPNLLGLEISKKENFHFYSNSDEDANRKRLVGLRRDNLLMDDDQILPKLMGSDSHNLNKLGTNAEGNEKLTRIKVDELNFHAFKVALLSHESRIRLEDLIPEQRPVFNKIFIEGGLLDEMDIDLSPNLTCIIGSRGAGKSTLLETLRETSGNQSSSKVVDSDVWPQKITLQYTDEAGQTIEFSREKNNGTQNITDPINGISRVEIESYGQGETADTIQHSDENPTVLIDFLDGFLDLKPLISEDKEIITDLLENQSDARKLRLELLSLDETKKALKNEQKKLENLKKQKAGELVKYQNALIKERQIRQDLIADLKLLIQTYKDILNDEETFENFEKLSDEEIVVGKDYFQKVKNIVSDFSAIVKFKAGELNEALGTKVEELRTELKNWASKEKAIQVQMDAKKQELAAQGIPFDLGKINQISKDIIDLTNRVKKLENSKKLLNELQTVRKELIGKRKDIKQRIFYYRNAFGQTINDNLKNTLDGLYINVKYDQGNYSDEFEQLLKTTMDWRTSQVPRAYLITKNLSPFEFVDICMRKDNDALKALTDDEGKRFIGDYEAQTIVEKLLKDHTYEDFEALPFEDRPSISVTRLYKDDVTGKTLRNTKSISQLSLGQQQSVLLGILMLSKSTTPLIIDQPEDNLDSEFIFKTIVKNLRKIKESRQVIIVTHNPNIAVLGDAELIIPLKSTSVKSHVLEAGSIDRKGTREISCEILEGGKSAFKQRQLIYGIK
ncbi:MULTISPECIES: TrlF family AAA-like ATPase [Maribacter]|uniref:PHP domain-containing protein n=1 Tax=Maribacter flavus TaxID=1658664 RepID=A0ABU7IDC1_9FLAO|nr:MULTISPECIES: PHP domain-containing protein [Maribacter]MDC6403685.1 AAA family ATPase [Maribacter sp. PR66]MEE1970826.1 PHP domain-containing protein [Maribacter flavus]NNK19512.1 PHP domain-containing protein [Maribacter sp.]NNK74950.1 PHP domain-containing protein [Maribacter sp.]|tara:strand:- start:7333 stop:9990 length:2658 start_codon:yes stop_codon:yes gene_type:complete